MLLSLFVKRSAFLLLVFHFLKQLQIVAPQVISSCHNEEGFVINIVFSGQYFECFRVYGVSCTQLSSVASSNYLHAAMATPQAIALVWLNQVRVANGAHR